MADQGRIFLVGRTQTTTPGTIGLAMFFADTEDAARAFMKSDAAVLGGVMTAERFPYRVTAWPSETSNPSPKPSLERSKRP